MRWPSSHRRARRPAQRARHVHEQDRHRPGLSRGHHRSRRARSPTTLNDLAKAKGVPVREITACILDRPRHAELIKPVREAGAAVQLIPDGDIAGVIWTTDPQRDRHRHLPGLRRRAGRRARRRGAALHRRPDAGPACSRAAHREGASGVDARARKMGIPDIRKKYSHAGDGVGRRRSSRPPASPTARCSTGVHFRGEFAETETVVMRSKTGTVRRIKTNFRNIGAKQALLR